MKKKTTLSEEDQALFRQLMAGTRKIKQDTIVHRPQRKKISEVPVKRLIQEQADASHYFSDEFQPLLNTEGPVKYVRPDVSHFEAKKLRRGDYSPELFLDLHGLTQLQAKQELGALIAACRRNCPNKYCGINVFSDQDTDRRRINPTTHSKCTGNDRWHRLAADCWCRSVFAYHAVAYR